MFASKFRERGSVEEYLGRPLRHIGGIGVGETLPFLRRGRDPRGRSHLRRHSHADRAERSSPSGERGLVTKHWWRCEGQGVPVCRRLVTSSTGAGEPRGGVAWAWTSSAVFSRTAEASVRPSNSPRLSPLVLAGAAEEASALTSLTEGLDETPVGVASNHAALPTARD